MGAGRSLYTSSLENNAAAPETGRGCVEWSAKKEATSLNTVDQCPGLPVSCLTISARFRYNAIRITLPYVCSKSDE